MRYESKLFLKPIPSFLRLSTVVGNLLNNRIPINLVVLWKTERFEVADRFPFTGALGSRGLNGELSILG
jgi:hypothetical protein